eukprot:6492737-Amphidinium_carterae.1
MLFVFRDYRSCDYSCDSCLPRALSARDAFRCVLMTLDKHGPGCGGVSRHCHCVIVLKTAP